MNRVKYIKPWNIGEIVLYKQKELVILDMISYENEGSCNYDRKYKVCRLSELDNISQISEDEFNKLGYWIDISKVSNFPEYIKLDIAPFEIKQEKIYRIRQKTPVIKTRYI